MLEKVGPEDRKAVGGYVTVREGDDEGRYEKELWIATA
jgi:hypothetical protein